MYVRKNRTKAVISTGSESGMLIHTAASVVTQKLVQNLLLRIEKTITSGKPISADTELEPVTSGQIDLSRFRGLTFSGFEIELLLKISSNEIGGQESGPTCTVPEPINANV